MDVKDIHSFMECYETRSINKAAKSLYISPQGLGKLLDRLEHELRAPLFDRTKQGLIPTEAGVFLYDKSQKLLTDMQEIEQGLELIRNKKKTFHIGYSCGLIRMLPMKKMEAFQAAFTGNDIIWDEGSNQDVKDRLVKGQLDIALVIGRVAATDFVEKEVSSKQMCAVVPSNHPLYDKDSIQIRDLKDEQLITLNEKYQSYTNLLNTCEREGFYPNIRAKTMEAAMIYEFVSEGLGIGIDVDIHSKDSLSDRFKLIPIADGIPWSVYVAYNNNNQNNPLIKCFLDMFIE
ncbi:DNA-binding transcriptional regulator, LysR family [Pseudobutyrivibrio sp. ACV-2]|uniref:LysR family transcriptional regulator n=1 Tax=Pseudobutyrivibrio sp. ACV-2 TaxID=1520801 RepID=UPI00089CAF30|nr:LysR family transcriptional regulator [Pseudobutyrivibrio sp. ACV-2]SEA63971.1 DNA-binding transcriptional regulator, LysR family [Pseudobutyrivibrio sp. ACV-2]